MLAKQLRGLWLFARSGFEADRPLATLVVALNLADHLTFAISALGVRALTDAAVASDARAAGLAVGLLVLAFTCQFLAQSAGFVYQQRLRERTTLLLDTRLAELTARIPTLEHLERPDYPKELELLSQQHAALADVQYSLILNLATIAAAADRVRVAGTHRPRPPAACRSSALPAVARGVWSQRRIQRLREALSERWRLHGALHTLATTAAAGEELRLFGLGGELLARYGEVRAEDDRVQDREGLVGAVGQSVARSSSRSATPARSGSSRGGPRPGRRRSATCR